MLYKEVVTSFDLGTPDNQVLNDSIAKAGTPRTAADELLLQLSDL